MNSNPDAHIVIEAITRAFREGADALTKLCLEAPTPAHRLIFRPAARPEGKSSKKFDLSEDFRCKTATGAKEHLRFRRSKGVSPSTYFFGAEYSSDKLHFLELLSSGRARLASSDAEAARIIG